MGWRKFFIGLSLVINLILAYSLIWGDQGLRAYRNLNEQYQLLQTKIQELDEKNVALSREIRLLRSDAKYQEKVIRNRFNFVKDNEILYIFPDTKETAKTGAGRHETKD